MNYKKADQDVNVAQQCPQVDARYTTNKGGRPFISHYTILLVTVAGKDSKSQCVLPG